MVAYVRVMVALVCVFVSVPIVRGEGMLLSWTSVDSNDVRDPVQFVFVFSEPVLNFTLSSVMVRTYPPYNFTIVVTDLGATQRVDVGVVDGDARVVMNCTTEGLTNQSGAPVQPAVVTEQAYFEREVPDVLMVMEEGPVVDQVPVIVELFFSEEIFEFEVGDIHTSDAGAAVVLVTRNTTWKTVEIRPSRNLPLAVWVLPGSYVDGFDKANTAKRQLHTVFDGYCPPLVHYDASGVSTRCERVAVGENCSDSCRPGYVSGAARVCQPDRTYSGATCPGQQLCFLLTATDALTMGCPSGVISSVDFASWGHPVASCPHPVVDPGCHVDMRPLLETECLGAAACVAPASVFTTPSCPSSWLSVVLTCSDFGTLPPASCQDLMNRGQTVEGRYNVDVQGQSFEVYCTFNVATMNAETLVYARGNAGWTPDHMVNRPFPARLVSGASQSVAWFIPPSSTRMRWEASVSGCSGTFRHILTAVPTSAYNGQHLTVANEPVDYFEDTTLSGGPFYYQTMIPDDWTLYGASSSAGTFFGIMNVLQGSGDPLTPAGIGGHSDSCSLSDEVVDWTWINGNIELYYSNWKNIQGDGIGGTNCHPTPGSATDQYCVRIWAGGEAGAQQRREDCSIICAPCANGTYAINDACEPCPPGTYSGGPAAAECSKCPPGTNSSTIGALTSETCEVCPPGLTSAAGASVCSPCHNGERQVGTTCIPCPPAEIAQSGATECLPCPVRFVPSEDQGECVQCPVGSVAAAGTVACITCGAAQAPDLSGADCEECPPLTVAGSRDAECRLCSLGSVPNSDRSNCSSCPLNAVAGHGATECSTCSAASAPNDDNSACRPCFSNQVAPPASPACSLCPAGSAPGLNNTECIPCAPGLFASRGSFTCAPCADPLTQAVNSLQSDCECMASFYRDLTQQRLSCLPCPAGAECAGGSARPRNLAGFYCQNAEESVFAPCFVPDACLLDCQCRKWHNPDTAGCSACLDGSYKPLNGDDLCRECPYVNLVLLAVAVVVFAMLMSVLLVLVAKRSRAYFPSLVVGLNFIQIVSVLGYLREWPPLLSNFFRVITVFTLDIQLVRPECAFTNSQGSFTTIWFLKFFAPVFVGIFFLMMYGCLLLYCYWTYRDVSGYTAKGSKVIDSLLEIDHRESATSYKQKLAPWREHLRGHKYSLINAFLTMLSVVYLMSALTSFQVFVCLKFDLSDGSTVSVLEGDPTIRCSLSDPRWVPLLLFGLIGIIVYVILVPVGFAVLLWKNAFRLGQKEVMAKYGLLYRRYRISCYYWEVLVMTRKLALVVARSFFSSVPILQLLLCFATALVSAVVTWRMRPYVAQRVNRLDLTCLGAAMAMVLVGCVYELSNLDEGPASTALQVCCIIVWTACILLVAVIFLRDVWEIRRARKYGLPDDVLMDDLLLCQGFFELNCKLIAYKRMVGLDLALGQRQQQVRFVLSAPAAGLKDVRVRFSTVEEYEESMRDRGVDLGLTTKIAIEEERGEEISPARNVLVQILNTSNELGHAVVMVDVLMPRPAVYVVELIGLTPARGALHLLHCTVNAQDRANTEASPGQGAVVTLATARPGVHVYSPINATLIPGDSVVFKFQVPGASQMRAERDVRESAASVHSVTALLSDAGKANPALEEEIQRAEEARSRQDTPEAKVVDSLLTKGAGSNFLGHDIPVWPGDRFHIVAVVEGKDEVIAHYTAATQEDKEEKARAIENSHKKRAPALPPKNKRLAGPPRPKPTPSDGEAGVELALV